jgi:hypothetical protein
MPMFPTTPTKIPDLDSVPSAPPANEKIPLVKVIRPTAPIPVPDLSEMDDEEEDDQAYNEEERLAILKAGKHAKFATSALLYDDVKTAISNLEQALELLKPLPQFEN